MERKRSSAERKYKSAECTQQGFLYSYMGWYGLLAECLSLNKEHGLFLFYICCTGNGREEIAIQPDCLQP